jgi:hypothetical protein
MGVACNPESRDWTGKRGQFVRDGRSEASCAAALGAALVRLAVHYAVRARISIERGRTWQAVTVHWIDGVRDEAIALACRHRGLEGAHTRGAHELPPDVQRTFEETLLRGTDEAELRRALDALLANARRAARWLSPLLP